MIKAGAIHITQSMVLQIGRIDEFKGLWTGLEAHTTSLRLLADVSAFGGALRPMLNALHTQQIDAALLQKLHGILHGRDTQTPFKTEEAPLVVKSQGETLGTLDTAPPDDVAHLIDKVLLWSGTAVIEKDMHPLIVIAVFAAVFLHLHPFEHGNQKCLYLLITVLMLKAGYDYAPYGALQPIINDQAPAFLKALQHNQNGLETGSADWSVWIEFFLGVLQQQTEFLRERLLSQKDEIANLPALSAEIMKLFDKHDRLQMKQIVALTGGRRSTIKLRLQELVENGYICRHGQARGTWYALV